MGFRSKPFYFSVTGREALFTDPLTKLGGDKFSYHIPTYAAMRGIVSNIYWKPTILWKIDKVRVINPIVTCSKGMTPRIYEARKNNYTLSIYTYLVDVEYHVQAHYVWNNNQAADFEEDRIYEKHDAMFEKALAKGGRLPIFLGTSECIADVQPIKWSEKPVGYYKDIPEMSFGIMFHSYQYPEESGCNMLYSRLWHAKMRYGEIDFTDKNIKLIKSVSRPMQPKIFGSKNSKQAA